MDVDNRVTLCTDNKYRWVYELNMLGNFAIYFTVIKVLAISGLAPFLLVTIMNIIEGHFFEYFFKTAGLYFAIFGGLSILGFIAYLIVAKIYGNKYVVLFEMDEDGIEHIQLDEQFDKAKVIGYITAMAGALKGNASVTGAGLMAATRNSIYSSFPVTKKVIGYKKSNLIKVNGIFFRNQIYVEDEDYDFVFDYIRERCSGAKIYER